MRHFKITTMQKTTFNRIKWQSLDKKRKGSTIQKTRSTINVRSQWLSNGNRCANTAFQQQYHAKGNSSLETHDNRWTRQGTAPLFKEHGQRKTYGLNNSQMDMQMAKTLLHQTNLLADHTTMTYQQCLWLHSSNLHTSQISMCQCSISRKMSCKSLFFNWTFNHMKQLRRSRPI